jgi:hypothetical protein
MRHTKNVYYVDGHEKTELRKYRKMMVSNYLQTELHMHHWIQSPLKELEELEEEK